MKPNLNTPTDKGSQGKNEGIMKHEVHRPLFCLVFAVMAALLMPMMGWGQTDPFVGYWYIASNGTEINGNNTSYGYNPNTPETNYYLRPAADPQQTNNIDAYWYPVGNPAGNDSEKPFLTTNKTGHDVDIALWKIVKTSDDYYYLIHVGTGKYVKYEPCLSGNDARRKCFHLQACATTPDDLGETEANKYKFEIYKTPNNDITIRPKNVTSDHRFFNIGNRNQPYNNGQTSNLYFGGLIGLYNKDSQSGNSGDPNSRWRFESASPVAAPVITPDEVNQKVILSWPQTDVTVYYTLDGSDPSNTHYDGTGTTSPTEVIIGDNQLMVKAIAYKTVGGVLEHSEVSSLYVDFRVLHEITTLDGITTDGKYKLIADIESVSSTCLASFTGYLDFDGHKIGTLSAPLFTSVGDVSVFSTVIKNLVVENVTIAQDGKAGAIAGTATGNSSIYNIGILDGSVASNDNYCGGLVGELTGLARVVNCYNYASVSGTHAGGIVGYNNENSTSGNVTTMVMNCMVYGDVTGSTKVSPVYGGNIISNCRTNATDNTGMNNYNYYSYEAVTLTGTKVYNCALAAEDKYLQRWEFYRSILNSNRKLAAWYATGSAANDSEMMKWVLPLENIGTEHPYPILKVQDTYPSIMNPDAANAVVGKPRNQGGKLGTLTVKIQMGSGGAEYAAPDGADLKDATYATTGIILNIIDKDTTHFTYNYRMVQLPYYNEVGTKNYTGNRVVTGWKIVAFVDGEQGTFTTTDYDAPNYNYADREHYAKDLYSVSGRVFSQGAYFDVPDGVTGITIEPYWALCTYLCDEYYDVTYDFNSDHTYSNPTGFIAPGERFSDGKITIDGSEQVVYTTFSNAVSNCDMNSAHNVYDHAIVLVGNYHKYAGGSSNYQASPFTYQSAYHYTVMSADLDHDNEPDNCFIVQSTQRSNVSSIRLDFLPLPGMGMTQKVTGSIPMPEIGILRPTGWFEVSNTCLIEFGQFEYDFKSKALAPLILLGGIYDQIVSTNDESSGTQPNHTSYMILGGTAWFKMFNVGTHGDRSYFTPKRPISVSGGDFEEFYLSGMFNPKANNGTSANDDDKNAECYIDGGRFGEVASGGMEQIDGNVTWLINNADITSFYGGGINYDKAVTGNISIDIKNSHVTTFCGGPKFGDMVNEKTVTTIADDCVFGDFFGAGYGGTSFNRNRTKNLYDETNYPFNDWVTADYTRQYSSTYHGIATEFEGELMARSGGGNKANAARFYVKYADLSLAETRDVTSTLTGCEITRNFYGGGSLGKVTGTIESVLENCTVLGNVFGGGFSASVDPVKVMPKSSFIQIPEYNTEVGIYIQPIYPVAVEYTWEYTTSTISAGSEFDGTHILTNTNTADLGVVSGTANLTLKGTTTVGTLEGEPGSQTLMDGTGNVYGGGDQSEVQGNTSVFLEGDTNVLGNVFGGGNRGAVSGNTSVTIRPTAP